MTSKADKERGEKAKRDADGKPRLEKERVKDLDVEKRPAGDVRGGDSRAASGGGGTDLYCDTR